MVNTVSLVSNGSPGVYLSERTFGAIPKGLSLHKDVFVLGYSASSGYTGSEPYFIGNLNSFTNIFPGSLSTASVKAYFAQKPGSGIHFINVRPRKTQTYTVTTSVVGETYSLTIAGNLLSVVAVTGDTTGKISDKLAALINDSVPNRVTARNGSLRVLGTQVITSSPNITLGTLGSLPAYPTASDVLDSLDLAMNDETPHGFIIAPEFFKAFTSSSEFKALAQGMESKARELYDVAIVDCSNSVATQTELGTFILNAKSERAELASPLGHSAYYAPYITDTDSALVPPSGYVVGVAVARQRSEGFLQPPAGISFPLNGAVSLSQNIDRLAQDQLNPLGINCIRSLHNKGVVIYGARTLSENPYYKFVSTRVIMNVLDVTLLEAFDYLLFTTVDGLGVVFSRISQTATSICERMRVGGALFGATPNDAYKVVCDLTNNPSIDLENGKVNLEVYVKPSPMLEQLIITVYRTDLGTNLNEASTGSSDTQPKTANTVNTGDANNAA